MDKFNKIINELFSLYKSGKITRKQLTKVSLDIKALVGDMEKEEGSDVYTIAQVALKLGVSTKTVYRYIESGKLKATKLGQWRVKEEDLNKLINK